jgi:hypothetical protein
MFTYWSKCAKIFIRNQDLPVCQTCVHFLNVSNNYPYDKRPSDTDGRCKKFGELHCITGLVEYDYAMRCRNDESKCGKLAVEYQRRATNI